MNILTPYWKKEKVIKREKWKTGKRQTATKGIEEGIFCGKDAIKHLSFCDLCREVLIYETLHKNQYMVFFMQTGILDFNYLPDTVAPNTAKTARTTGHE